MTTTPPRSSPRFAIPSAERAISSSPSWTRPEPSTASTRSPSPSKAKPISASEAATRSASASTWVEPQPALMLRPSGSTAIASTVGAEALEDRRGGAVGGAVGAVEDDLAAGEVERESPLELPQVVLEAAVQLADVARVARRRAAASIFASISASTASASFTPRPSKNLIPLS